MPYVAKAIRAKHILNVFRLRPPRQYLTFNVMLELPQGRINVAALSAKEPLDLTISASNEA
jgi:hypothetical protein